MIKSKKIISITLAIVILFTGFSVVFASGIHRMIKNVVEEITNDRMITQYDEQAEPLVTDLDTNAIEKNKQIIVKYKERNGDIAAYAMDNDLPENTLIVKQYDSQNITILSAEDPSQVQDIVNQLNIEPNVEYAQPNYALNSLIDESPQKQADQWPIYSNVEQEIYDINILNAWNITKGSSNTVIGLFDSGINVSHPELANNIYRSPSESANGMDSDGNGYVDDLTGWNFVDNNNDVTNVDERDKHGTAMAGIIAADGSDGLNGIAPNCKIMPLKIMNNDVAYTSDIIEAIAYAEKKGIRIANFSFGSYEYNQALFEAMRDSSLLFVCAAGNDGVDTAVNPIYPASFALDNVISVGASNEKRKNVEFSNYGEDVDISAPGIRIMSTSTENSSEYFQGTSISAAYVSGAAALVLSENPDFTNLQVKNRLLNGALNISSFATLNATGGILDTYAALTGVVAEPIEDDGKFNTPIHNEAGHNKFYTAMADDTLESFLVNVRNADRVGVNESSGGISMTLDVLNTNSAGMKIPFKLNYNSRAPEYDRYMHGGIETRETLLFLSSCDYLAKETWSGDIHYYYVMLPNGEGLVIKENTNSSNNLVYLMDDLQKTYYTLEKEKGSNQITIISKKDQTKYIYNMEANYASENWLQSITDKYGNQITYTYGDNGSVTIKDPANNSYLYEVTADGWKITEQGTNRQTTYVKSNNVITITDPEGIKLYIQCDGGFWTKISQKSDFSDNLLEITYAEHNYAGNHYKNSLGHSYDIIPNGYRVTNITDKNKLRKNYSYINTLVPNKCIGGEYESNPYSEETTITSYDTSSGQNQLCSTEVVIFDEKQNEVKRTVSADNFASKTYIRFYEDMNPYKMYAYNDDGNYTEFLDFDQFNNPTRIKDPERNTTQYEYDDKNNLIKQVDELGTVTNYYYDFAKVKLTSVYHNNERTSYEYYPDGANGYLIKGLLKKQTLPNGAVTEYTYYADGKVKTKSETMNNGLAKRVTEYGYDEMGNLNYEKSPEGHETRYYYNNRLELVKQEVYPNGQTGYVETTVYKYDNYGSLKQVISPNLYDLYGENNSNIGTRYVYDKGRLMQVTDAENNTTQYCYDYLGNKKEEILPNGSANLYEYDILGRLTGSYFKEHTADQTSIKLQEIQYAKEFHKEVGYLENFVHLSEYRTLYKQKVTTKNFYSDTSSENTVRYYDYGNRLLEEIRPDASNIQNEYNANGTLKKSKDANGYWTLYEYDFAKRITSIRIPQTYSSGKYQYISRVYQVKNNIMIEKTCKNFVGETEVPTANTEYYMQTNYYNYDGTLYKKMDDEGRQSIYTYDNEGHVTKEEHNINSTNRQTIEYVNNHTGKPVSIKKHVNSGEIVNPDGTPFTGTYIETVNSYDKNGNLETVTSPTGVVTTYAYDNLDRQISISQPGIDEDNNAVTITVTKQYNYAGQVIQETDAKGNISKNIYNQRGFLTHHINAANGVSYFAYDVMGRKTMEVSPMNYTGTISLANTAPEAIAADITGLSVMNRTEYTYKYGNIVQSKLDKYLDSSIEPPTWKNITISYTYDKNGNMITQTDGMGYVTEYAYDPANKLIQVINPEEKGTLSSTGYEYDARGRLTTLWKATDSESSYTYDNAGNLLTVTSVVDIDHRELMQTYTYDLLGNVLTQTDGEGAATTYEYNALNQVKKIVTPGDDSMPSNTTVIKYDANGNMKEVTDSTETICTFDYDKQGRQIAATVKNADGSKSITAYKKYDLNGNLRFAVDGNGNVQETTYDALNQPQTRQIQGTASTMTYEYDKNGNVVSETDFRGNTTQRQYDPLGRLVKTYDADGVLIEQLTYNNNHMQTSSVDAMGKTTTYTYDKVNRLLTTTDPLNHTSGQTYNFEGLVDTRYDGNNNTVSYEYDQLGRLKKATQTVDNEVITTAYTYDLNNHLLTQTNGEQHTTSYEYNNNGLLVRKYDHGGSEDAAKTEYYTYFCNGNVKTKTDRNGNSFEYFYDVFGRKVETKVNGETAITETFDNNGNKLTMTDQTGTTVRTYDALNRVLTKSVPDIGISNYTYDITENLTEGYVAEKAVDPKGNITLKIYDNNNRMKEVKDGSNATSAVYEYYANGARKKLTYPNGATENYTYYDDGTLASLINRGVDGTATDTYEYTYDAAKNMTAKTENVGGVNKGQTTYTYDALNRLSTVMEPSGKLTSYTYDKAGNRKTETITGNDVSSTTTYTYNEQERLIQTEQQIEDTTKTVLYTYDNNGNVHSKISNVVMPENAASSYALAIFGVDSGEEESALYEYDAFNQLVKCYMGDTTVTNSYNGEGKRVSKDVNGNTCYYLYEYDKIVLETDANGTETARNVYGTNLISRRADDMTLYYQYNGHADIIALTDVEGEQVASYYYDAFGVQTETTGNANNPYRYAGYQKDDETGLYYLQSRFYDAAVARFVQEDTYGGKTNDPLSLNLYTYCLNNPLVYIDPSGYAPSEEYDPYNPFIVTYESDSEKRYLGYNLTLEDMIGLLEQLNGKGNIVLSMRELDFKDPNKVLENIEEYETTLTDFYTRVIALASEASEKSGVPMPQFFLGTPHYEWYISETPGFADLYAGLTERILDNVTNNVTEINGDADMIGGIYFGREDPDSMFMDPDNYSSGLSRTGEIMQKVAKVTHDRGKEVVWIPYIFDDQDLENVGMIANHGAFWDENNKQHNMADVVVLQPGLFYRELNPDASEEDFMRKMDNIFDSVKHQSVRIDGKDVGGKGQYTTTKIGFEFEYDMSLLTGRVSNGMAANAQQKIKWFSEYIRKFYPLISGGNRAPYGIYAGGPNETAYRNPEGPNTNKHGTNHRTYYGNYWEKLGLDGVVEDASYVGMPYNEFSLHAAPQYGGNLIYDITDAIINGNWTHELMDFIYDEGQISQLLPVTVK